MQRSEERMKIRINKLKEVVHMLFKTCSNSLERIKLVDAVQHLGIAHLFEIQIGMALSDIHESELSISSLHEVALRFRLLREHGLWVSPDVFKKFRGEDGSFNGYITNDPKGLLCLYNAAYTLTHGEPELRDAISFARHHLESLASSLESPLAEQVKRALHVPLPRTYRRLEALRYMPEYEQEEGHNPILLELAKLEFNLLQGVHLKELKAISEWYSDLKGYVGLSFARDRVVESYLAGYCVFYEEEHALPRMIFAKLNFLQTMLDDINDVSATLEEYGKLDAAIQRWDESAVSLVPGYLTKFYNKLLICFKEFDNELRVNRRYSIDHIKKKFQLLSSCHLQEAEWLHKNHKPRFEDKLHLGAMSVGAVGLCVYMMVCMGDKMPKGALEWALGYPDVIMACAKIGRLMNDLAASFKPRNNMDVANCVECYASEHKVAEEVAFSAIDSMIEDEWRTTNQARFQQGRELLPAVQRVVNLTLSVPVYYGDRKDAFTFSSHLEDIIKSLFVKPIPI
ncbi:tau-cadinol synthase-like [Aegilops tauschii subsp. strangulata]|uniref:tau-cadinol synthase-like n=1 Tax=Aegilops tauschii subsp. strangulata TaxID=200361 RepID=UPI001E1CA7D3|nr:tau-cadinol synthase-like [Aegilops tauschii subsp. strangulata]